MRACGLVYGIFGLEFCHGCSESEDKVKKNGVRAMLRVIFIDG
jgi:hypothetical protein